MLTASSLVVIAAVAVLAPLLVELPPRVRVPVVVAELALGIVIGPHLLHLAAVDDLLRFLANLGLAFLFFLAGLEIDYRRIAGRPVRLAASGWAVSLALALAIAAALEAAGFVVSAEFVAAALCTTALGTLTPIIRDAGEGQTAVGRHVVAVGACGEFFPVLLISLLLTGAADRAATAALLVAFAAVAALCGLLAVRVQPPWIVTLLGATMHATSQLPVRLSLLALVALVYLAEDLGLDVVLGAFTAGVVVALATRSHPDAVSLTPKLEAIGYGFLIPIFFITSGMAFDLDGLLAEPSAILRVPAFLALFLLVRAAPAVLLYRRELGGRDRIRLGLYSATALPLVVAITSLAVAGGHMRTENATALVAAAMLSVLVFPLLALSLRRDAARPVAAPAPAQAPAGAREEEPPLGA